MPYYNDQERFSRGESSDWNSAKGTLYSLRNLLDELNLYSRQNTFEGYLAWLETLHAFEREMSSYLTPDEAEELRAQRVAKLDIPNERHSRLKAILPTIKRKLDAYEKLLRLYYVRRGFGIKANQNDPEATLEKDRGY